MWIGTVCGISFSRFAFISCEQFASVWSKGDHIRLDTGLIKLFQGECSICIAVKQGDAAIGSIIFSLECCCETGTVFGDGYGRHITILERSVCGFHNGFDVNRISSQQINGVFIFQSFQWDSSQGTILTVYCISPSCFGIIFYDFHNAAVCVADTGIISCSLCQSQRGDSVLIFKSFCFGPCIGLLADGKGIDQFAGRIGTVAVQIVYFYGNLLITDIKDRITWTVILIPFLISIWKIFRWMFSSLPFQISSRTGFTISQDREIGVVGFVYFCKWGIVLHVGRTVTGQVDRAVRIMITAQSLSVSFTVF